MHEENGNKTTDHFQNGEIYGAKGEFEQDIDFDTLPSTVMMAQEFTSILTALQHYFKVLMPASPPEESKFSTVIDQEELERLSGRVRKDLSENQDEGEERYLSLPKLIRDRRNVLD